MPGTEGCWCWRLAAGRLQSDGRSLQLLWRVRAEGSVMGVVLGMANPEVKTHALAASSESGRVVVSVAAGQEDGGMLACHARGIPGAGCRSRVTLYVLEWGTQPKCFPSRCCRVARVRVACAPLTQVCAGVQVASEGRRPDGGAARGGLRPDGRAPAAAGGSLLQRARCCRCDALPWSMRVLLAPADCTHAGCRQP
jgi:hypothetical protein